MTPTRTFVAKDVATKKEIEIGVYPRIGGGVDLRGTDGRAVYKIGKGRYRILDSADHIELTSDDPDAP